MSLVKVEGFENLVLYITSLYKEWSKKSRDNTPMRLSRMVGSDFDYTCIRRLVMGDKKNPSFDLFDCVFRALNPEKAEYIHAIRKWFPHMIEVADRISQSGIKPDQSNFLSESLIKEIYQHLISGLEMTRAEILQEWGNAGIRCLEDILRMEHIKEFPDGKIRVVCENGYLRVGGYITMKLISHNVSKVTPENSGTGHNLYSYRVFYLSKEKKQLLREKTRELYSWIDSNYSEKEDAVDGEAVVSIQTVIRTHGINETED